MAKRAGLNPIRPEEWSPRHARHLLNRAGFGVPESEVARLASLGPAAAVGSLMDYQRTPDNLVEPNFLVTQAEYAEMRRQSKGLPEDQRRKLNNEMNVRERQSMLALQAWWVERMVHSPRPLQEKMTLFWHGHFATSAQKVKASASNYQLNSLFRAHATGNFKALTTAVGQSPAMLRYLDNVQNVKGQPNENWARELMELFTMGVDNYSEDDIKNSARSFTGWTMDGQGQFHYDENRHDFGEKKFFKKTGNFDGWDILNIIFEQPATAEFISRKLWTYFAYEHPEKEIVSAMAEALRKNHYELAPVLQTMFMSEAFYSEKAIGTQIKSPMQFLVQLANHLAIETPPYIAIARASGQLGQQLFYPPNVKGWDGNRAWINANTLLTRYNMSRSIVVADLFEPDEASMLDMGALRGQMGKNPRQQMQAAIQEMPPAQRQDVKMKMAKASSAEEKRAVVENTVLEFEAGKRWNVKAIFRGLQFSNAEECVNALAGRYLNTPLAADQKKVLLSALTPTAAPTAKVSPDTLSNDEMTSVLHLFFSLAEYQLC